MYGNKNAHRILTADDVRMIRELHAYKMAEVKKLNDTLSAAGLAEKFGVHVSTVEKIIARKAWETV